MRVSSLGVARPSYYDRNASPVASQYVAQVAPHASTVRITRTIASGRKDLQELVNLTVIRSGVATATDRQIIDYSVTPSGGSSTVMVRVVLWATTAQLKEQYVIPAGVTFYSGDIMTISTQDTSVGGDGLYYLSYRATSFDS